jgi:exodeoxyribonuclease VII large subunit
MPAQGMQKGLDFGDAQPAPAAGRRRSLSVSELTERIQGTLEVEFADVWVEGEVSNLKVADSGHWYFSLKDEKAQIRAVVWKTAARLIKFRPKDGMKVLARGRVSVYPLRGEYQLSVEVIEPLGKGSLQQAFEELKERLEKEGLFDPKRKRPLPMLPRRIGIVTSPSGAVIRDILRVLRSRYRNLEVLLYPARVQGENAAAEIAQGIRALNQIAGLDVLIVARGGGSIEDLWAFNEEVVARALSASRLPTISAVGHESDFTIADFVADLRAPTPSAAAERVVQAKADLEAQLAALDKHLTAALTLRLARVKARVTALTSHRVFEAERGRIRNRAHRVDDLVRRTETGLGRIRERSRDRMRRADERLAAFRWDRQVRERREGLVHHGEWLHAMLRTALDTRRAALSRHAEKLDALSPLKVLARGYALVWDASQERLVRRAVDVNVGDAIRIRLHDGALGATVTAKES